MVGGPTLDAWDLNSCNNWLVSCCHCARCCGPYGVSRVPSCSVCRYWTGAVLYPLFSCITMVVLLNLLIAIMSATQQSVSEQSKKVTGERRCWHCHLALCTPSGPSALPIGRMFGPCVACVAASHVTRKHLRRCQVWWLQRAELTLSIESTSAAARRKWIAHLNDPARAWYQQCSDELEHATVGYFKLIMQEENRYGDTVIVSDN